MSENHKKLKKKNKHIQHCPLSIIHISAKFTTDLSKHYYMLIHRCHFVKRKIR